MKKRRIGKDVMYSKIIMLEFDLSGSEETFKSVMEGRLDRCRDSFFQLRKKLLDEKLQIDGDENGKKKKEKNGREN